MEEVKETVLEEEQIEVLEEGAIFGIVDEETEEENEEEEGEE